MRFSLDCSDEFSCYSGSSSSYSGASARSCVSESSQRGRLVNPLRVLAAVASLRRIDPKVSNLIPTANQRLQAVFSVVTH